MSNAKWLWTYAGPRFALVFLWYILTARHNSLLPKVVAGTGLFRTVTCGGWTYVTSTDDHGWHDIFMISYLVATVPWTLGCLALSPNNAKAVKYRKIFAGCFFGTLIPLIYFFIQHKVHKVAGGKSSRRVVELHENDTDIIQRILSTPSLNGHSSFLTLASMLSLQLISRASNLSLETCMEPVEGMCNGFRSRICMVIICCLY